MKQAMVRTQTGKTNAKLEQSTANITPPPPFPPLTHVCILWQILIMNSFDSQSWLQSRVWGKNRSLATWSSCELSVCSCLLGTIETTVLVLASNSSTPELQTGNTQNYIVGRALWNWPTRRFLRVMCRLEDGVLQEPFLQDCSF